MPGSRPRSSPRSRPSLTSVARHAGVSIATVSRIVNGVENKASADTIDRVQKAIRELGYRPGSVGRALRQGQSRLVALLAANLANPAMAAIAASAESALRAAGFAMVLCDTHDRADQQDEYLLEMRAQLVRGIVLLGAVDSPQLRRFVEAGDPPLVFVNRRNPVGRSGAFVGIDNEAAGADVAAFFLERGITDLAMIHGPLQSSATAQRVAAFRTSLARHGTPLPPERVVTGAGLDHLAIGHQAMAALLARGAPPQGLFCLSDLIAFGAQRALREAGHAGRTVIMGFDDTPLNEWVAPWLSSVRVPYDAFGPAILRAMTEAPAQTEILPHSVVVRRTG